MRKSPLLARALLASASFAFVPWSQAQATAPMRLIQTIPLAGITGKFDHMAIDIKGRRLLVAAETKRSIEVIDLRDGKVIHTITSLPGDPRKVVYNVARDQFWVDLGNGDCQGYDGNSYRLIKTIPLSGPDAETGPTREPDAGTYDPASQRFFVGNRGDKSKAACSIDVVDTNTGVMEESIKLADHDPTGLAIDSVKRRLYVTLAGTGQVAVVDLEKHAVIASWPITGGPQPHALALDATGRRLFVGSRVKPGHLYKPGKMVVMDADTGKVIQALDSEGGADEVAYDPSSRCIFLTGASGAIDVYQQVDADHYRLLEIVPTGAIAKTSLLVPELKRLYVAVPKHVILTPPTPESEEAVTEDAKILVFEVP